MKNYLVLHPRVKLLPHKERRTGMSARNDRTPTPYLGTVSRSSFDSDLRIIRKKGLSRYYRGTAYDGSRSLEQGFQICKPKVRTEILDVAYTGTRSLI